MGDPDPVAAVALADREGRRGDRLLDPERATGAADQRRLAGPDLAGDDDDVAAAEAARRARAPERFGLGGASWLSRRRSALSRTCPIWSAGGGGVEPPSASSSAISSALGGGTGGGPASRSGIVAKSPRSVSFTAGVRSAAAGWKSGSRKTAAAAELVHLRACRGPW